MSKRKTFNFVNSSKPVQKSDSSSNLLSSLLNYAAEAPSRTPLESSGAKADGTKRFHFRFASELQKENEEYVFDMNDSKDNKQLIDGSLGLFDETKIKMDTIAHVSTKYGRYKHKIIDASKSFIAYATNGLYLLL